MWFLRLLRISWTANKSNETMFRKTDTISLIITMCKCRATCFGHGMRREKLEQLVTTGMLDRKKKQQKKTM